MNVDYTFLNDYDSGIAGNAWANDTIDRHLQIRQAGDGQFCAVVADEGSFVTFAGASPGNTGTVDAGIKGRLSGGYTTTVFTGTLDPLPGYDTKGQLGTFDLACTDAYTCPGAHPSYSSYFSSTTGDALDKRGWAYHTPKNGDWVNEADGNSGDTTS